MKYPYELIAAYNDIADVTEKLNRKRQDLLVAICGMCRCGADKCDGCVRLCNFELKED